MLSYQIAVNTFINFVFGKILCLIRVYIFLCDLSSKNSSSFIIVLTSSATSSHHHQLSLGSVFCLSTTLFVVSYVQQHFGIEFFIAIYMNNNCSEDRRQSSMILGWWFLQIWRKKVTSGSYVIFQYHKRCKLWSPIHVQCLWLNTNSRATCALPLSN